MQNIHGKNICDCHFARLNSFYNSYTTSKEFAEPIYTTEEFISLLQKAVLNSNEAIAYKNSRNKTGTKLKKLMKIHSFTPRAHDVQIPKFVQFLTYSHNLMRNSTST